MAWPWSAIHRFSFPEGIKAGNGPAIPRIFYANDKEEKNMKKLIAALCILTLALGVCPALAEGVLRVGMECGYAPYNWQQVAETEYTARIADGSGYADGYDVQIARRIAQALDMELEIVKTEWDGLIPSVLSGNIDMIIAGMSPTAERKMTIDFTDHYYQSELVVVVRKDGAFANAKTLADLSGAVICAQLNTFHDTVIDQIPGVVHDIPRETFPAMIVNLLSGAIDGYIAERPGAEADVMANPDLTYVQFEAGQGFEASEDDTAIAIGLAYGSPYKDAINKTLSEISEDERVQIMLDATARQPLVAD
jgi:putative lysine transport system substrate-binding protein